jgi:hypothetical protein
LFFTQIGNSITDSLIRSHRTPPIYSPNYRYSVTANLKI